MVFQAVGQLADGNGNSSGAKVVTALYEAGNLSSRNKLNFTLFRRVALLHSEPQASRRNIMRFEDPVAPPPFLRFSAQQDYAVSGAGFGVLPGLPALPDDGAHFNRFAITCVYF